MSQTCSRRYPKDTLNRRVRGRRTPSGKRVVLTTRDFEIFKLLSRYRFLRSTTLWELLPEEARGRSFKRFQDRLTDLFHETNTMHGGAYLDWPLQQRKAYDARYSPSIYELAPAGETALEELGVEVDNVTDLGASTRAAFIREFAHMMMICDTLASIEKGTLESPKVRFISWPEILTKAPPAKQLPGHPAAFPVRISHRFGSHHQLHQEKFILFPDGLFGLEYQLSSGKKLYRFFAIEAERCNRVRTKSLKGSSYLKKILAYRYILENKVYKTVLGLPNLLILTVTPNNTRIQTMKEAVTSIYGPKGCANFLYHSIPVHGEVAAHQSGFPDLFTEPWERVGFGPFYPNMK